MLKNTGIPTAEDVKSVFPTVERMKKGPVAIIECFERIPCDPCHTACNRGAMQPFSDINDLPHILEENCNGCGICIYRCPGLAIMVADMSYCEEKATLKIPYEFAPVPKQGETVVALDRAGNPVCDAVVVKVLNTAAMDNTVIVSLEFDKEFIYDVRHFRFKQDSPTPQEQIEPPAEDISIICRCSDIDVKAVREYIAQGFCSIDEIKRISRLGMGPCQGRNCIPLVLGEISRATGQSIQELKPGTYRPLTKSMDLGAVAAYEGLKEEGCE